MYFDSYHFPMSESFLFFSANLNIIYFWIPSSALLFHYWEFSNSLIYKDVLLFKSLFLLPVSLWGKVLSIQSNSIDVSEMNQAET